MTRPRVFTLALVTLLLAAPGALSEDDQLVRCEPSRFESALPARWGVPEFSWMSAVLRDDIVSEPEEYEVALAKVVEDEIRAAGGDVTPVDGGLRVEGAEAAVIAARRVADIDRFVQGRGVFRIAVVHVPGANHVVDAAALRGAVADGAATVLWSSRLTAARGESVTSGEIDETTFVAAIDAEVAIGASVADPEVAVLATGLRVGCWHRPLDADRTRAFVSFQLSRVEGMEQIDVASGVLDLPRVSFVATVAPLLLEKDVPSLVVMDHPWADGVVVVMVEALDLPDAPDLPYRLIDTAAVAGIDFVPQHMTLGLDNGSTPGEETADPYARASALVDALVWENESVERLTSTIVVLPLDATLPAVAPGATLRRRVWSVATADLAALPGYDALDGTIDRDAGPAALSGTAAIRHVRIPVFDGLPAWFVGGMWTRVPSGVDVEIAQSAVATLPIVYSFVEGDAFSARVIRDDAVHVEWESVRALSRTPHSLAVRTDIDGKRVESGDNLHIAVRHRRSRGSDIVTGRGPLVVRRLPGSAEISAWERE